MPKEPMRARANRPVLRFPNGIVIGKTKFTAAELASIEAVANLSAEDLAALADTAELATAVGTYEGENDIVTDLAAAVSAIGDESAGLVKDVSDLQSDVAMLDFTEDLESGHTYTYDATPSGAVTATVTAGKTYAVITPGGATAHALTFALPAAAAANGPAGRQ